MTLCAASLLLAITLAAAPALGQSRQADALAGSVPAEVLEVQSGGSWQDGGVSGTFRVVTTVSGADKDYAARVHIQWVAFEPANGLQRIHKSTPIKEFNDLRMPHVLVAFDGEMAGEASVLLVSRDDARRLDVVVSVRATRPGHYALTEKPSD